MEEKRLKVFFDSEFTGLHQDTTLVSTGLVAETGETFYAEFDDWNQEALKDKWFRENVAAHLLYSGTLQVCGFPNEVQIRNNLQHIKANLGFWFKVLLARHHKEEVELWSDCLAYDWVLFCELWGGALKIPDEIYYIPFDICTLFWQLSIDPDISREKFAGLEALNVNKHNALWDAQVIRVCFHKLIEMRDGSTLASDQERIAWLERIDSLKRIDPPAAVSESGPELSVSVEIDEREELTFLKKVSEKHSSPPARTLNEPPLPVQLLERESEVVETADELPPSVAGMDPGRGRKIAQGPADRKEVEGDREELQDGSRPQGWINHRPVTSEDQRRAGKCRT